ncbi:hypothetical protein K439DRAFT_1346981 [Ramaria rubella]|nr:hypothetical protein K439DRAFT_1346981 [Ramaria rubella]
MGKSVASAAAESINLSKETGKVNSLKQTKGSKPVKVKNSQDSGSNDSSGNSSDSSNESDAIQAQKVTKKATSATTEPKVPASDALTPLAKSDTTRTTKKRRLSENGKAVATAVITTASPALDSKLNGKKPRKSNTPFRRIKAETVEFYDERLKDNAFVSKGGSTNDYGARANQDLIVTRGDGFRKEKNKKKRGSYRGGEITVRILGLDASRTELTREQMQSHSIKFT